MGAESNLSSSHAINGPTTTAYYGMDAPGVMCGLLGVGAVGLFLGTLMACIWRSMWGYCLAATLGGLSSPLLVLGLAMAAYVWKGKLRLRDWLLARHTWRGDEVVLDVGAGRGLMAIGAAKRVPRGRVLAVDIWRKEDLTGNTPDALATNARIEGVFDRIEVVTADARKLNLPDQSIDVVLSVLCIHNIEPAEGRASACREIARVLKPGGRALIGDYVGTASYATEFKNAGLAVRGPINLIPIAFGLMWVVEATRLTDAPPASPVENSSDSPLP